MYHGHRRYTAKHSGTLLVTQSLFHLNADLALLESPSQITSGARQMGDSVYTGTCESLEKGDGDGGGNEQGGITGGKIEVEADRAREVRQGYARGLRHQRNRGFRRLKAGQAWLPAVAGAGRVAAVAERGLSARSFVHSCVCLWLQYIDMYVYGCNTLFLIAPPRGGAEGLHRHI
jgi:hypothetical protein